MPNNPVICDNSPLVSLWRLNLLALLQDLYTEVWIPPEVKREFLRTDQLDRQHALKNSSWIRTVELRNLEKIRTYTKLDRGETEVFVLAEEHNARLVIIDEQDARQEARNIGLPVKGTVGVLLEARKEGLIDAIKPLLFALRKNGFYLGDSVIADVLREADEI